MRILSILILILGMASFSEAAIGTGGIGGTGAAGNPGGSNTQIQFNDSGSFNGTSNPTYDKASGLLIYGIPGYVMTDASNCTWNMTINTSGALVSTLINCGPVAFKPCTKGISLGLLLALTCAGP